ncbi:unnamed protein product [Cuscuta epithymum]|uniref:HORMA domain-containing protein n=1 Tax=Cuscuta epithymum TaxID=186058 RepID=A0AAV0BWD3_9ASTE|nr:unnamed protein product [Cuscuta epithymum]
MDHIATQATQTAQVLVEFLEVAINSVIFLKGVYPTDCRWEITGYFRALPDSRSSASRIWVSTGTKQWQQPPVIMPIKSMKSEALVLQLYLEHPPTPLHQNFSLS